MIGIGWHICFHLSDAWKVAGRDTAKDIGDEQRSIPALSFQLVEEYTEVIY